MARKQRNLADPTRTRVDPVTHATAREVHDAVWWAVLRAGAAVERVGLHGSAAGFSKPWGVVVQAALGLLAALEDGVLDAPRVWRPLPRYEVIVNEWAALDAAGRTRFAKGLRAKLVEMVPYTQGYGVGRKVKADAA